VPGALSTAWPFGAENWRVGLQRAPGHNDKEWSHPAMRRWTKLAQYGKPPPNRPSPTRSERIAPNIAAWIKKQRQVVLNSSYVAKRMTEMQSQSKQIPSLDR